MISGLPYDAEVEYLESTGTQWIDTGVYGNQSSGAEVMVSWPEIAPDQPAFSADNGSISSGSFAVFMSRTLLRYGRKYAGIFKNGIFQLSANVFYDIVNKPSVVSVDGDSIVPDPSGDFSTEGTVPMFAWRRNANIIIKGKARIAFMKMWSGDTLVRDYIPVRFTNELGVSEGAMYDRVSRRLFRNAGTGAFVISPDVATPVMGLHFMPRPKYTARDYVQTGLIAMWDGIENIGHRMHSDGTATWKDLAGSCDLTIASGAQFESDHLRTNGVGNAARNENANWLKDATYYEAVFQMFTLASNTSASYVAFIVARQNSGYYATSNMVRICNTNPASYIPLRFCFNVRTSVAADTSAHQCCCAFSGADSASMIMLDGSSINQDGTTGLGTFANGISIGSSTNGANVCDGKLYSLRVYSRIPTPAEIAANYAIDKERFNLP